MIGSPQTLSGGNETSADRSEDRRLETLEDFARQVRRMARQEATIRSILSGSGGMQARGASSTSSMATDAKAHYGAYQQLIARIRDAVEASIPAGATVAVVSKGDPKLLELGGRRAWHLPQTPQGVYAGNHPADGAEAVAHLESLRAKGAQFLLLPATSFWWLDHYLEFRRHLEGKYRRVRADDACVIFSLAASSAADAAEVLARQGQYQETVRRIRLAVQGAIPVGTTVAVVSKGDADLLDFERRRGWHFPQTDAGVWAGHHPAGSDQAIRHLAALRSKGAGYFVLPSTSFWWLEHYRAFREHLEAKHRQVLADKDCLIFKLGKKSSRGGSPNRLKKRSKAASSGTKAKSHAAAVRSKSRRRPA